MSADWWRHSHITHNTPSLTELVYARNQGIDLTDSYTTAETYLRTGKEPTREEQV